MKVVRRNQNVLAELALCQHRNPGTVDAKSSLGGRSRGGNPTLGQVQEHGVYLALGSRGATGKVIALDNPVGHPFLLHGTEQFL